MKNPFKRYSKINPQRENGHNQIANDVYTALIRGSFLGSEYKVIFTIISKTWGFNKLTDAISIKQFQELTNLKKRTIQATIKKLKALRVIYYAPSGVRVQTGSPLNRFMFNKHYDTWKVEGCNILQGCRIEHPLNVDKGAPECKTRVQPGAPTKESITKDNTKDKLLFAQKINFDLFWKAYPKKRSKEQARKTWDKLKPDQKLFGKIVLAISEGKKSAGWQKKKGQFIPYPATWLNAGGWKDEYSEQPEEEDNDTVKEYMANLGGKQ